VLLSAGERAIAPDSSSGSAAAAIPTPPAKPLDSSSPLSANSDPSALKRSAEIPTPAQPLPPSGGPSPRAVYRNQEWLRSTPGNHYAIQLAIVNQKN